MHDSDRRRFIAGGLAAAAVAPVAMTGLSGRAAAAIQSVPLGTTRFRIERSGATIGEHVAEITRRDGFIHARNRIDISVGALGLVLFRYAHASDELRDSDGIIRIDARTDDDGETTRLSARRDGRLVSVDAPDATRRVPADILTTGLWHPDTPRAPRLLNLSDGDLVIIQPNGPRREMVDLPGIGLTPARAYRLNDPLHRTVWYDDANRLIAVNFISGEDGSHIRARATDLPT